MIIDAHVHCRDFAQRKKETVRHALEVARDSGVSAIFDMPNTDPALTTKELILARLALAKEAGVSDVFYGLYAGVTPHPEQIKGVVALSRLSPQVVGLKMYAGQSVGDLAIPTCEEQGLVYATLASEGYEGVIVVHAEKEDHFLPELWDAHKPFSHCLARPEAAEIASVQDQIQLSQLMGYKGKLHIPHISSPKAVEIITEARKHKVDISCSVCPHHLLFDWTQMDGENGILWKMNPPLRAAESRAGLVGLLKRGEIDWIETDHAPHLYEEKVGSPWMSGIPGLASWPFFLEYLRREGFSDARIRELVFDNVANRFGVDIAYRMGRPLVDRTGDYAFQPYARLAGLVR